MTEGSLGSGRRWCKHEVGSVIWIKIFWEISSLREARVVRFAAVNMNIYSGQSKGKLGGTEFPHLLF